MQQVLLAAVPKSLEPQPGDRPGMAGRLTCVAERCAVPKANNGDDLMVFCPLAAIAGCRDKPLSTQPFPEERPQSFDHGRPLVPVVTGPSSWLRCKPIADRVQRIIGLVSPCRDRLPG